MLLSDYLKIGSCLDENGIFDQVLEKDSHFFINLQRLKKTTVPEFQNAYSTIQDFFRKIIKLLEKAEKKHASDTFFRQALRMFKFSEVNGIGLGFAKGVSGSGFGPELEYQVICTAYDIVKVGITDPEFFELLPLFQEKIGPDRLSDMLATLISPNIESYTKRINIDLNITPEKYAHMAFDGAFLINPYKGEKLLLVPTEILHKLPVAADWEDIDVVANQNAVIRAEMNDEVANTWIRYSASERKAYIKHTIFQNADTCTRVIEGYKQEELDPYNPQDDFQYYLAKLEQRFGCLPFEWQKHYSSPTSHSVAMNILEFFQQWVENNKGWEVIQNAPSTNREKILQRIFHLSGLSYIKANNLDMSCEPDEGRGPVDFKISRGQDITIVEVKLSSNNQYLHGYEVQIEEYGKAEQTEQLIYVLVDLGNPIKVNKLKELHDRKADEGERTPDLLIIDSTQKESASRA